MFISHYTERIRNIIAFADDKRCEKLLDFVKAFLIHKIMAKVNEQRYISYPIFMHRDANRNFEQMIKDIASYGIYKASIKHGSTDEIDMRVGLKYLGYNTDISNTLLDEWKLSAIRIELRAERLKCGRTNYPISSVKASLLKELRDEVLTTKKKDEFLGSRAVRSILGKKNCIQTGNKHVLARMMGYNTHKELLSVIDNLEPYEQDLLSRYLNPKAEISKHKMKTLFKRLINNWKILKASDFNRGYYIAIDNTKPHYMTMKKLAKRITDDKENRKSNSKADRLELDFKRELSLLKKSA